MVLRSGENAADPLNIKQSQNGTPRRPLRERENSLHPAIELDRRREADSSQSVVQKPSKLHFTPRRINHLYAGNLQFAIIERVYDDLCIVAAFKG